MMRKLALVFKAHDLSLPTFVLLRICRQQWIQCGTGGGLAPLLHACIPCRSIGEQREKGVGGCDITYLEDVIAFILRLDLDVSSVTMFYSVTWNPAKCQN